jgi:hypothetical protein
MKLKSNLIARRSTKQLSVSLFAKYTSFPGKNQVFRR